MRVPTMLQWKGHVAPGQVASYVGTMMDWFPTFIHLAGAALPDDRPIDGMDLSAVLTGDAPPPTDREFAYYKFGALEAYRAGDWKLILPNADRPRRSAIYSFPGEPVHDLLLYNLREDIGEQNNLANAMPDTARMLETKIDSFLAAVGDLEENKIVRAPADQSHLEFLREKYAPNSQP
jgi:arylsulfatase